MSEKISAGGLWESLKGKFNLGPKKSGEVSLAGVRAPAVAPVETIAGATPEPTTITLSGPTAVEVSTPQAVEFQVPPAAELPDWLTPPEPTAFSELPDWLKHPVEAGASVQTVVEAPAPTPAAVAPDVLEYLGEQEAKLPAVEVPAVEVPAPVVAAAEVKAEDDPFATNREFNGYMEIIRNAQAVLATGIELDYKDQKKALIAVARANSLLPKLPPEVFKSVLLMRAVASGNPKFNRNDFQLEMLGAMDVIKGKK